MNADRRSWHLKVDRAEQHLEEVKAHMAAYATEHPYRAERARQPKGQRDIWLYRLRMLQQPDPMIAVIIGEILYDLRSALDHIAVGMAPRSRKRNAGFPVEMTDPSARDADGNLLNEERHRSFLSKIEGIPQDAAAMIMYSQPYNREHSEIETLALLNRLENADKHRELVALGAGVMDIRTVITAPKPAIQQRADGFREDGAEVAKFKFMEPPPPPESEVKVDVRGTASVAIKVGGLKGNLIMPQTLEILIGWMRDEAIPEFMPYIRPD
jgi:hypothetical protein